MRLFSFLLIWGCLNACNLILPNEEPSTPVIPNTSGNGEQNKNTRQKGSDLPPRQNFKDKDLRYQDQAIKLTHHGRCRMECRKIDAYEIQEVINQGKVNAKKSNPNSKPCPTIAFEGKTIDNQTIRVVLGTCEGNYKIVTVIDLKNDWKCDCK